MSEHPLFSTPFHEYTQQVKEKIKQAIERAPENEIATADNAYIEELLSEYKLKPVAIDWDKTISLTSRHERKEMTRDFAWGEREIIRQVYTFEVKYTGSRELLYVKPSTSRLWRFEPNVSSDTIRFEIADEGNEQSNKQALQRIRENLEFDVDNLNSELGRHNSETAAYADGALSQRKQRIEDAVQNMGGFGVPVRRLNLEPEE